MMETLGTKISRYRKLNKMTQEDLAAKLNVSAQAVSKWENDLSIPDLPLLIELADLFGLSLDELIREKAKEIHVVEQPLRKPIDQMMLKIIVNSEDGDKVRVNLPLSIVKAGIGIPQVKNSALNGIDLDNIFSLVEQGVVGKLVEIEDSDGDIIEIIVE